MHLVELRTHNWIRFRGEQRIVLVPGVYGVVARKHSDPLASNWSGKTSLLNAVRFVLYGAHAATTEDGWITRGEREGGVGAVLSDGTVIERRRGRNAASPQWWVDVPAKGKDAATRLVVRTTAGATLYDDAAQAHLVDLLGLDLSDFEATCWIGQKQAARFVIARPAERMTVIAGWLRLEPLQRAERVIAARLAKLYDDETRAVADRASAVATLRTSLAHYFDDATGEELEGEVLTELRAIEQQLRDEQTEAKRVADAGRSKLASHGDWQARAKRKRERDDLQRDLDALDVAPAAHTKLADAKRAVDDTLVLFERAGADAAAKATAHKQARTLASGAFDGCCPVDGHACPDRAVMNARRTENRTACEAARAAYDTAERERNVQRMELDARRAEHAAIEHALARAADLRKQIDARDADAQFIARAGMPPPNDELLEDARQAEDALLRATTKLTQCLGAIDTAQRCVTVRKAADDKLLTIRHAMRVQQAAQLIVGKQGAQRLVAERAVAIITGLANDALAEAGIELRVAVRWARETKDLAEVCDRCGAAFPRGRAAKTCTRCGAARGPKLSEKVEVELSDTSGAAEDIAGVTLQLAAATWLRATRGSSWSMVLLDEPLAACDRANRKAMASHVVALLRGRYGFEQALMTAHTTDAIDAMPARIEVVAHEDRSTMEVL